jgi:hypothetical protein
VIVAIDALPRPKNTLPLDWIPAAWQVRMRRRGRTAPLKYARRWLRAAGMVMGIGAGIVVLGVAWCVPSAWIGAPGLPDAWIWALLPMSAIWLAGQIIRGWLKNITSKDISSMVRLCEANLCPGTTLEQYFAQPKAGYRHEYALILWLLDDQADQLARRQALIHTAQVARGSAGGNQEPPPRL